MTAEQRASEMLPYRKLFAAVIEQAVKDCKAGPREERAEAAHWLYRSVRCREILSVLGIDHVSFRKRLARATWFVRAVAYA